MDAGSRWKRPLFFLAWSLVSGLSTPAWAEPKASPPLSGAFSLQACAQLDKKTLRADLQRLLQKKVADHPFPIERIIRDAWTQLNLDQTLHSEIDRAASVLQNETGYWQRLRSSFSKEKAKELAQALAKEVFASKAFEGKLQDVVKQVGGLLEKEIEGFAAVAVEQSILCFQHFAEKRYHTSVRSLFGKHLYAKLSPTHPSKSALDKLPSFREKRGKSLAGASLIATGLFAKLIAKRVSQQIITRFAQGLGYQILSRVGTKFIPWVGWGLLVWDAWSIIKAEGALPEIQKAFKAPHVREQIIKEIIEANTESMRDATANLILQIADLLSGEWDEFQRTSLHLLRLLEIPETQPSSPNAAVIQDSIARQLLGVVFHQVRSFEDLKFLESIRLLVGDGEFMTGARLGRLSYLFSATQFRVPLLHLLRARPSLEEAVGWLSVAGSKFQEAVLLGLYEVRTPHLPPAALAAFLRLRSKPLIRKAASLSDASFLRLAQLVQADLLPLIQHLSVGDLSQLSQIIEILPAKDLPWIAARFSASLPASHLKESARWLSRLQGLLGLPALQRAAHLGDLRVLLSRPWTETLLQFLHYRPDVAWLAQWIKIASKDLDRILALRLHQFRQPHEIPADLLAFALEMQDPRQIDPLFRLSDAKIRPFTYLPKAQSRALTAIFSYDDLSILSDLIDAIGLPSSEILIPPPLKKSSPTDGFFLLAHPDPPSSRPPQA